MSHGMSSPRILSTLSTSAGVFYLASIALTHALPIIDQQIGGGILIKRNAIAQNSGVLEKIESFVPIERKPEDVDVGEMTSVAQKGPEKEEPMPPYKIAVVAVAGGFILLALISLVFWCVRRSNRRAAISRQQEAAAAAKYAAENTLPAPRDEEKQYAEHHEIKAPKQAAYMMSRGTNSKNAYLPLSGADDLDDDVATARITAPGDMKYEQYRTQSRNSSRNSSRSRSPPDYNSATASSHGQFTRTSTTYSAATMPAEFSNQAASSAATSRTSTWKPYNPNSSSSSQQQQQGQFEAPGNPSRSSSMYTDPAPIYGDIPPVPMVPTSQSWKAHRHQTSHSESSSAPLTEISLTQSSENSMNNNNNTTTTTTQQQATYTAYSAYNSNSVTSVPPSYSSPPSSRTPTPPLLPTATSNTTISTSTTTATISPSSSSSSSSSSPHDVSSTPQITTSPSPPPVARNSTYEPYRPQQQSSQFRLSQQGMMPPYVLVHPPTLDWSKQARTPELVSVTPPPQLPPLQVGGEEVRLVFDVEEDAIEGGKVGK